MAYKEELPQLEDDDLPISEVGAWSEEKYRLVAHYASMFVRAIRHKWKALIYLDLFAGPGYSKFKGTSRIVPASPLAVLRLPDQFDGYIFCEENADNASALQSRCARDFPDRSVTVITGDANRLTPEIINAMPQPRRDYKVLGFCFLDPFNMGNLQFSIIQTLSQRYMDFLVLIPSGMDTNRNEHNYIRADNMTMDEFVGNNAWRSRWKDEKETGKSFEHFVVEEFGRTMSNLGYIDPGLESAAPVRSDDKNLLLYRLALYSRSPLGNKFWRESKKYTNPQTGFNF